jgi:hypothetical protein
MAALTQERLKELLTYSPETGLFYWLDTAGRKKAGRIAGTIDFYGYRVIGIDGYTYGAHRLAVLYVTGKQTAKRVDHINGKPGDDRWENLRECSHAENQKNMRRHRDNSSGFKGVYTSNKGRTWFSQIMSDGKLKYLGSFATKEEAAAAYDAAATDLHGQFARLNEAA